MGIKGRKIVGNKKEGQRGNLLVHGEGMEKEEERKMRDGREG